MKRPLDCNTIEWSTQFSSYYSAVDDLKDGRALVGTGVYRIFF